MGDQEIKDEVLEAEKIIRGLAQRMKDADAALQTAEVVRQSLADARTALQESSAHLDNLGSIANDSIRRVEEAAQNQMQRTEEILLAVSGEISKESQGLRELHGKLAATAQSAAKAEQIAREKEGEVLVELRSLSARLPVKIAEATASTVAALAQEVQRAQQASEILHARMEHTKNEVQSSLTRDEDAIQEIRQDLLKLTTAREAASANLNSRFQESFVRSTAQIALVESNLKDQIARVNRKGFWIIVLQLALMAGLTTAALLAIRFLHH